MVSPPVVYLHKDHTVVEIIFPFTEISAVPADEGSATHVGTLAKIPFYIRMATSLNLKV